MLFLSEFLVVKAFLIQKHYILCALFLFLLTVVLFGMARVVIKMVYGKKSEEKFELAKKNITKISKAMYIPQVALLTLAFVLGVYIPKFLDVIIRNTLVG